MQHISVNLFFVMIVVTSIAGLCMSFVAYIFELEFGYLHIDLGHFVKMVNKLFFILAVGYAASEESKCDPFPFGTNILHVVVAAIIGSILPNFCPCSNPCTVQSVEEHIQFFYTKR